jgi:hypothetical protein
MKLPHKVAAQDVVGTNVSGGRHPALARGGPKNEKVLKHPALAVRLDAWRPGPAGETFAQIHTAVSSERQDRLAGVGVDRLKKTFDGEQNAPILAIRALPIVHATRGQAPEVFVDPELIAVGRIEGDNRAIPSLHICDTARDDRPRSRRPVKRPLRAPRARLRRGEHLLFFGRPGCR